MAKIQKPVKKKPELLRGVALVEAANAKRKDLTGMAAKQVASMKFGTKPLSPALTRWLELDEDLFTLGEPQSIVELVEAELDGWAEAFTDLGKYLKEPCVLFEGWGADSRRFLYLGKTDAHGEYPVFTIDVDDTPFCCINGPADVWLAQQVDFLAEEEYYGFVPEEYEPARKEHARLSFGGNLAYLDGEFHKKLDPYA
ncbi:MAG: hypothetical protein ABI867_44020 [Kofleriaceae bacterium]